jgi:hypothetical protein
MKTTDLVLSCIAEKQGDQWQALCLDLCLAAQADTMDEARDKLEAMIADFVLEATDGPDKDYADQLLNRRAPLKYWLRYYAYLALSHLQSSAPANHRPFFETLPLVPASH